MGSLSEMPETLPALRVGRFFQQGLRPCFETIFGAATLLGFSMFTAGAIRRLPNDRRGGFGFYSAAAKYAGPPMRSSYRRTFAPLARVKAGLANTITYSWTFLKRKFGG